MEADVEAAAGRGVGVGGADERGWWVDDRGRADERGRVEKEGGEGVNVTVAVAVLVTVLVIVMGEAAVNVVRSWWVSVTVLPARVTVLVSVSVLVSVTDVVTVTI